MIEIKGRKHAATVRDLEVRVTLAEAEIAGVFVFDLAESAEGFYVPIGEIETRFQSGSALGRFDESDTFCSGSKQGRGQCECGVVMGHVGFTDGTVHVVLEIGAGKVEFDGDSFVFDKGADATQEVEAFVEGWTDLGPVGFAGHNGDGAVCVRCGSRLGCGEAKLSEFQGEWGSSGQGERAMKEVAPGKSVCFH